MGMEKTARFFGDIRVIWAGVMVIATIANLYMTYAVIPKALHLASLEQLHVDIEDLKMQQYYAAGKGKEVLEARIAIKQNRIGSKQSLWGDK